MQANADKIADRHRGGMPRGLATSGPAILSYGFRPFFLGAGLFAVLSMTAWIGALTLGWGLGGQTYGPLAWHAHEMLFGYTTAALAGFMLTAIPNWTGRLPVSGIPLLALVGLWAVGRILMLQPDIFGLFPTVIVDGAFLPMLAAIAAREIIAGRNWKNLKILAALCLLTCANLGFHFQVLTGGELGSVHRAGVSVFVALIGLVGGRIVPSFTRNWLAKAKASKLPRPFGRLDIAAMGLMLACLLAWTIMPETPTVVALGLGAAALHTLRLIGWRGAATLEEPLLVVLHIAYAFVPLGLLCITLSALGWISAPSALHVLTVGALGNMTLAVMTRSTLGHTGRKLSASPGTSVSYLALLVAAVIRPFAELLPDHYHELLGLSGACWILAFVLFSMEYGRMLLAPRLA
ncbi:MAG TPA: NnrS family protein [Devosia sp.]|jgi:uncharacterized protein involved in response to NO|uniref:NnrS family protein n=1 Tax=Devosia sp. TaxID=1871048 RepID=UPI002DDDA14C|nr:NnrS family protein [Devosia sp.]HEV2515842.1 NnrS family protein [Devosia sp.]